MPAKRTEYWVTARDWGDAEISAFCEDVANLLLVGKPKVRRKPKDYCEFIFCISRTCLPDVRGNYYWPDLHREVCSRLPPGERHPSEFDLTGYFRQILASEYAHEITRLRNLDVHHIYVVLIFEQAGIGKDRNKIIRNFMEFLVDYRPTGSGLSAEEVARQAFQSFLSAQPLQAKTDTQLLGGVLLNVGSEVLRLTAFMENHPDRLEMLDWPWEQLRQFWLACNGSDLDSLTPSAANVLLEFIPRLSDKWLRSEVFRLYKAGKIDLRWPNDPGARDWKTFMELPVGPADIRYRGRDRAILVVDRSELTPALLIQAERDTWQMVDEDYFYKVSDTNFAVDHPFFGRIPSVPYYDGSTLKNAIRRGYFWGGQFAFGARPVGPAGTMKGRPRLSLNFGFRWRSGQLFLALFGFRAGLPDGSGYTLMLGKTEAWRGELKDAGPAFMRRRWFALESLRSRDDLRVPVRLAAGEGEGLETDISIGPLQDKGFLVIGRKIYPSGSSIFFWNETGSERTPISFLSRVEDPFPVLENLIELGQSEVILSGRRYLERRLTAGPGHSATVSLETDQWSINIKRRIDLSYLNDTEVRRDGVIFTGAGNIRVIEGLKDLALKLPGGSDSLLQDRDIGLWVSIAGFDNFFRLQPHVVSATPAGSIVNIGRLAADNSIEIEDGVIRITLGTIESKSLTTYNFFIPPDKPLIRTSRVGQPSRVSWNIVRSESDISSQDIVSPEFLLERKMARARLSQDDWELWLRWLPQVRDLTVGGMSGTSCGYRYGLKDLPVGQVLESLKCKAFLTEGEKLIVEIGDHRESLTSGAEIELFPLLGPNMTGEVDESAEIKIVARSGDDCVQWLLDTTSVVRAIEQNSVSNLPGFVELSTRVTLLALRPEVLYFQYSSGGEVLEQKELWLSPDKNWQASGITTLAISTKNLTENQILLTIFRSDTKIHECGLDLKGFGIAAEIGPESGSTGNGRKSILELVQLYRRTGSDILLVELFFEALKAAADEGRMPREISAIRNGIGGQGDVLTEKCFRIALLCLEAYVTDRVTNVFVPVEPDVSRSMRVIARGMWLLLSEKYARRGVLVPEQLLETLQQLKAALQEEGALPERIRYLGILLYEFGADLPPRRGIRAEIDRTVSFDARSARHSGIAEAIGNISSDFKDWMESK